MFDNARIYNTEGSIVYEDANQMQKVFDEALERVTAGLDIPMTSNTAANSAGVSTGQATPISGYAGSGIAAIAPQSYATPPRRVVKRVVESDDEEYKSSE